jgi:hypothetical protein
MQRLRLLTLALLLSPCLGHAQTTRPTSQPATRPASRVPQPPKPDWGKATVPSDWDPAPRYVPTSRPSPPRLLEDPLTLDMLGAFPFNPRIVSVVDGNNMIVETRFLQRNSAGPGGWINGPTVTLWIAGVATGPVVDGQYVILDGNFRVSSTKTYETIAGRNTKVFVLLPEIVVTAKPGLDTEDHPSGERRLAPFKESRFRSTP